MSKEAGLGRLGELERAVLEHLFGAERGDVRSVHRAVGKPRRITPNTVQSTLVRLHKKGLLTREKVSHAFVYAPACSRAEFHREVLGEVVAALMEGEPSAMLSAFVDLTERAGAEHLARLEELVSARRREGE